VGAPLAVGADDLEIPVGAILLGLLASMSRVAWSSSDDPELYTIWLVTKCPSWSMVEDPMCCLKTLEWTLSSLKICLMPAALPSRLKWLGMLVDRDSNKYTPRRHSRCPQYRSRCLAAADNAPVLVRGVLVRIAARCRDDVQLFKPAPGAPEGAPVALRRVARAGGAHRAIGFPAGGRMI
jgi:hypothetical protein